MGKKFVAVGVAQQNYRFREPVFESGCHAGFGPEMRTSTKILARSERKWFSDESNVCSEENPGLTLPVRRLAYSLSPRLRCVIPQASNVKPACAPRQLRRGGGRVWCVARSSQSPASSLLPPQWLSSHR